MKKVIFLVIFTTASLCTLAQPQNSVALDAIISPTDSIKKWGMKDSVIVVVRNVGTNNLTFYTLGWSVNGVVQGEYNYPCPNLPQGFSDTIVVGVVVIYDTLIEICVWVSMPNGVMDSITHDDTLCKNVESCLPSMFKYADTLCYGEVYNDANFSNLTQSGTYYDTLQNVNGCDSVIELTLSYYPSIAVTNYTANICEGGTYTDANFANLTQAGVYYDTLQNVNGCDSVIELTLIVNSVYFTQISDSISAGNSYNFFGKLLTVSGIYYDTLQTIHGCDSIFELTLTVITKVGIEQWRIDNGELIIESYEVFDILGRKHASRHCGLDPQSPAINEILNQVQNDVSALPAGIYIIKIYTNQGIITKKIIR